VAPMMIAADMPSLLLPPLLSSSAPASIVEKKMSLEY